MSEVLNPYSAPATPVAESGIETGALTNAGKGRRFGTLVVDSIVSSLFWLVPTVALIFVSGPEVVEGISPFLDFGIRIAVGIAYYVCFEAMLGRTPGKYVFGTRVVDERGLPPSFRQALLRTLCRYVPFEALSLLFSPDNVAWHDTWPKTRVVLVPKR